jgi:glycosyltransferase involved in cell wall biosynthesis
MPLAASAEKRETVERLKVCINTQTPLVLFPSREPGARSPALGSSVDLTTLKEGVDYQISPGGVTRMVYPLIRRLTADGVFERVDWVSLNPNAPETVRLPGFTLHNVPLQADRMGGYGKTKEAIWAAVHGLDREEQIDELFWTDEFSEYAYYNRTTAELIRRLDREADFDLFYIHDFQQLPVGQMLDTLKPKIFRWHIPFEASAIPEEWTSRLVDYLRGYDMVVVSSQAYRTALQAFGYQGPVACLYPFVDPAEYDRPQVRESGKTVARWGIRPGDVVGVVVARMDPTKGQDRVLRALAMLAHKYPKLRLAFVGNGSFTSSSGGLGLSKSAAWRSKLESTAHELGLDDRVVFTGHVDQHELDCFYERSAFTVLPSVNEGFGLVVVESWLHRRPALVTDRAGIAELIRDGENGLLFDPDDPVSLAEKMRLILEDPGTLRRSLTRKGLATARKCSLDTAAKAETKLLDQVLGA